MEIVSFVKNSGWGQHSEAYVWRPAGVRKGTLGFLVGGVALVLGV